HAASKFSHIHFPATREAANRLARMGEDKKYIFVVGCPSIDALLDAKVIEKEALAKILQLDLAKPYALVVQHPVTTELADAALQMRQTLQAIKELGIQALVIYPNNDAGSRGIVASIQQSAIRYVKSLPPEVYANALRRASVLVGNSSSGIHEAATFHVP